MPLPSPLPDSPTRWEGWRNYNSQNPYDRLCLAFEANPSDEQIEEHCRQLLVWWQKKLPLKNQPANPATQMLRQGLDDAPKYLAEARSILLNSDLRRSVDDRIRSSMRENATSEFSKYLSFALSDGILKPDDEANLYNLGATAGLQREEMAHLVEAELVRRGAARFVPPDRPLSDPTLAAWASGGSGNGGGGSSGTATSAVFEPNPNSTAPPRLVPGSASSDPHQEFARLLRLSGLSDSDMTDDQRDALCNMGENLGLTGGEAEDVIDAYLEEVENLPPVSPLPMAGARPVSARPPVPPRSNGAAAVAAPAKKHTPARVPEPVVAPKFAPLGHELERKKYPAFACATGVEMLLIPSGTLVMGSTAEGASPNEHPLTKTNLTCYYISRYPITNAQYELFDPAHRSKRATNAHEFHPVVYVNSVEAMRFCEWLSRREGKKFRLPTEAEWEYAARGTDGRSFPWGERLNRGDLANFADSNTTFPWRDPEIDDGFPEAAPIGSYPRGVSPFGVEDMAGNVWEWCLDFYEPYRGKERTNPHSTLNAGRRVYRGGSWKSRASNLRTTARNFNVPEYSANDIGFRVLCECH